MARRAAAAPAFKLAAFSVKKEAITSVIVRCSDRWRKYFIIEDDGIGFDMTAYDSRIGIENVRSRLSLLHPENHLEIETTIGEGTIVTLHIKAGIEDENIDC